MGFGSWDLTAGAFADWQSDLVGKREMVVAVQSPSPFRHVRQTDGDQPTTARNWSTSLLTCPQMVAVLGAYRGNSYLRHCDDFPPRPWRTVSQRQLAGRRRMRTLGSESHSALGSYLRCGCSAFGALGGEDTMGWERCQQFQQAPTLRIGRLAHDRCRSGYLPE